MTGDVEANPKKLKALVVHPGAEMFGSDRMALETVRGLRESGATVVVALPESGPLVNELTSAGAIVVILPMLVLRKSLIRPSKWPTLARDLMTGAAAGWRLLRRQRPDVVYVSTVTLPQWPLLARARRIPVVSHVHEAEASGSRLINTAVYLPHLLARTVLVNSRFSRRTITDTLPALGSRARVVYNGVAGPAVTSEPRPTIDELRVVYVGRLSPRKGVEDVIRAADELHRGGVRVRVTLLGSVFPGYEWFERDLRRLAATPGAPPVDFAGFQPDIWPVLDDHDLVLVPSRVDEPFGNTAVEGILARRPVIASDTSGLREAAGGYRTAILTPPNDSHALASAMRQVVETWEMTRDAVSESAALAAQRHSPAAFRDAVTEAVRDAGDLSRAPDRRPSSRR